MSTQDQAPIAEVVEPKGEPKGKPAKAAKPGKTTVTVVSKFDRFVDLVNNVEITQTPSEVVMHPWLQANVDNGLVVVC